ncbi:hemerythrin domain-containing protein [Oligoflexus tunisiensis]|uniref:hemerythrin domain-containing protein n=1 Tax=Oligoflexus tunisiensis TaxID=708132 RepID=UPI00114CCE73|nr:hemerythrin domain-containing protein [Oligoflexus tunisiensis]
MLAVSEQETRLGLASELADIEMRQRAIVQWNSSIRRLLANFDEARDTLEQIAEEDEKNLRMLETVMTNFGMRVEPKEFTKGFTELVSQRIGAANAPFVEKLGAYALVKQNQAMCGYLVHKVAQVCKPDVKAALGPFEGVQTSMEKQVAQISSLMEKTAVKMISGEEPATGVTGRIRDAAATVAGAVINTFGKSGDEMDILNILRMDHAKAKTLFQEIEQSNTAVEKNDLFYQLRVDLLSHSEAEEQTVYRHFQQFDEMKDRFDQAWSEHEEIRTALDIINNLDASSRAFEDRVKDLRAIVQDHVDKEEDEIFKLIRSKTDDDLRIRMSQDFISRKSQIQQHISPHIITSPMSSPGTSPAL